MPKFDSHYLQVRDLKRQCEPPFRVAAYLDYLEAPLDVSPLSRENLPNAKWC